MVKGHRHTHIRTHTHIHIQVNDPIKVLARVNDEWLKGECGGQTGLFPANFLDRVPDNLPIVESQTHSEGKDTTDSKVQWNLFSSQ